MRPGLPESRNALRSAAVDMGWSSDDRALADIATFGASRAVAEAFAAMVERVLVVPGSGPASTPTSAPLEAP